MKLTSQQETIQALAGLLTAVYAETDDAVIQYMINTILTKASQEYIQATGDILSPALFSPEILTKEFRQAIALMRTGVSKTNIEPEVPPSITFSKNGHKK